jgi:hypothetical protein
VIVKRASTRSVPDRGSLQIVGSAPQLPLARFKFLVELLACQIIELARFV